MDLTDARLSYEKNSLTQDDLPNEPFSLFKSWFNDAVAANLPEPYAMSLATCGSDQRPSVRIVLMRELTERGVVFYTNYQSHKGQDIADNPNAEVLFFWQALERQVRLSGRIVRIEKEKSAAYFAKRPLESQIGAWVSQPQSGVVADRQAMESRFIQLQEQFGDQVPYPEFWGGYELVVDSVEFWQGRACRMHDRIHFYKQDESWQIERLLP